MWKAWIEDVRCVIDAFSIYVDRVCVDDPRLRVRHVHHYQRNLIHTHTQRIVSGSKYMDIHVRMLCV